MCHRNRSGTTHSVVITLNTRMPISDTLLVSDMVWCTTLPLGNGMAHDIKNGRWDLVY